VSAPGVNVLAPRGLRGPGRIAVRVAARAALVLLALLAGALGLAAYALSTGDYRIPVGDVLRALAGRGRPADEFVVLSLRLPRVLTALLVGAAFGVGGALFQSVARNPLASPDLIGFDAGAATGALLVLLVAHGSSAQVAGGAAAAGVATALLVYLLAMKHGVQGDRLILVGIGLAAVLTAANDYLLTRATVTDARTAAVWLTGSLNARGWEHVRPAAVTLAVLLPLALWLGRGLRMLELGDDLARALGVHCERTRLAALVVGVGLAAVATASAGPVAFVALAAPQIARRLTGAAGPNAAAAALAGAVLLVGADLAAQRAFAPTQLPVGVVTAAFGGLYLAGLLAGRWRAGRG
jgi:iron complex transport system permease protein